MTAGGEQMSLAPPSYGIGIDIRGTSMPVVVFDDARHAAIAARLELA